MMVFLAGADHRGIIKEQALERELPQAMRPRRDSVEICTQGNRVGSGKSGVQMWPSYHCGWQNELGTSSRQCWLK